MPHKATTSLSSPRLHDIQDRSGIVRTRKKYQCDRYYDRTAIKVRSISTFPEFSGIDAIDEAADKFRQEQADFWKGRGWIDKILTFRYFIEKS